MSKIKKITAAVLAGMIVLSLAGCSKSTSDYTSKAVISGKVIDAGKISAVCPNGWLSVGVSDYNSADSESISSSKLCFIKDGVSAESRLTNAFIEIKLSGSDDSEKYDKNALYDDIADIPSFSSGRYEWQGYTGTSLGVPFAYLTATDGSSTYVAMLYMNTGGEVTASLYDNDVIGILDSIES